MGVEVVRGIVYGHESGEPLQVMKSKMFLETLQCLAVTFHRDACKVREYCRVMR